MNIKSPTPLTRFVVWAGVEKVKGRVKGRWMARAPPTPKNHATAAHAAAHTPDDKGQQKCVHERSKTRRT